MFVKRLLSENKMQKKGVQRSTWAANWRCTWRETQMRRKFIFSTFIPVFKTWRELFLRPVCIDLITTIANNSQEFLWVYQLSYLLDHSLKLCSWQMLFESPIIQVCTSQTSDYSSCLHSALKEKKIKTSWCLHITLVKITACVWLVCAEEARLARSIRFNWTGGFRCRFGAWPPGSVPVRLMWVRGIDSNVAAVRWQFNHQMFFQVLSYCGSGDKDKTVDEQGVICWKIPLMLNCKGSTGLPEDFYSSQKKSTLLKYYISYPWLVLSHETLKKKKTLFKTR